MYRLSYSENKSISMDFGQPNGVFYSDGFVTGRFTLFIYTEKEGMRDFNINLRNFTFGGRCFSGIEMDGVPFSGSSCYLVSNKEMGDTINSFLAFYTGEYEGHRAMQQILYYENYGKMCERLLRLGMLASYSLREFLWDYDYSLVKQLEAYSDCRDLPDIYI